MHKRRGAEEAEMEGLRCGYIKYYMVAVEKKEKKNLKEKEKRRGDVVRGRFVHAV